MLGNFSFGDYFKKEAIHYAWGFLTSQDWLGLDKERLWVTVYETDEEAYRIWNEEIGVPTSRIVRIGDEDDVPYKSDNFWAMGDTGPCGPCTEVFYDHGPEVEGGPPGSPEEDGDRYIEIWNVVFMQFNRTAEGEMHNLPSPSVDTGMGLERITAVLQGVHSNYEIDLFQDLLRAVSDVLGGVDTSMASVRVIADHIRSCAFLITDGVMPSNEGRGFVLRRIIIRRAARHGNKLGATGAFFHKLVAPLESLMAEAYPELQKARPQIEKILLQEEQQFARTLEKGLRLLEDDISKLDNNEIPGETVFTLYDTFGFPVDLTNDIARERGLTLDLEGYEKAMEAQRERARAASKFGIDYNAGCPWKAIPNLSVITISMAPARFALSWLGANAGMPRWVIRPWWSWTRHPSMPRPEARLAIREPSAGPADGLRWRIPAKRMAITCTSPVSSPVRWRRV